MDAIIIMCLSGILELLHHILDHAKAGGTNDLKVLKS